MVETTPVPDVFCSGLGKIERLEGNCLRFYLYATQAPLEGGQSERVIVARIVAPMSAVPDAIMQLLVAISGKMMTAIDSTINLVQ